MNPKMWPEMKSEKQSEDSTGGREGDVERDILLPARAKIISPGLVRRNVRVD